MTERKMYLEIYGWKYHSYGTSNRTRGYTSTRKHFGWNNMDSLHYHLKNTYYVFQGRCYIGFLKSFSNQLVDHYDTLPQFVLHPPLIFGCIVHYQESMSEAYTLEGWREIAKLYHTFRTCCYDVTTPWTCTITLFSV